MQGICANDPFGMLHLAVGQQRERRLFHCQDNCPWGGIHPGVLRGGEKRSLSRISAGGWSPRLVSRTSLGLRD
jgi:hypothetical protein